MLHEAFQDIMTGESGSAEYILAVFALSMLFVAGSFTGSAGNRSRQWRSLFSAVFMIVVSRVALSLSYYFENNVLLISSLVLLVPAIALLAEFVTAPFDRRRFRIGMFIGGAAGAVVLGGSTAAYSSRFLHYDFFRSYAPIILSTIPVGMFFGACLSRAFKCANRVPGILGVVFVSAATPIAVLVNLGFAGNSDFFSQLFALIDLAGFAFLLSHSLVSKPATGAGGSKGEDERGQSSSIALRKGESILDDLFNELNDSVRAVLKERPAQESLNRIVEGIARITGASFVLLRTMDERSEMYRLRSFYGLERIGTAAMSSFAVKRNAAEGLFEGRDFGSGGAFVAAENASSVEKVLAAMVERGSAEHLYIVPLEERIESSGYLTIGYLKDPPTEYVERAIEAYRNMAVHILWKERVVNRLKESEKTLSLYREELDGVNQLKSNFLSVISHELKTPLTSIKAYAETLLENLESIETRTVREFVKVMDGESERLIKLVDNILSFSYMEMGNLKVEKVSFELDELLREVYASIEKEFVSRGLTAEIVLPKSPVIIKADRELVKQLLQNLINNAVKFSPEGGKVYISLDEEASFARIIVQDTGKGIPEDQLEKIFERFHQVDGSDTREYGGSGLGLAICKNIVDWHEGKIWMENVKGSGAKVVVLLPMKDIYVRQALSKGFIGSRRFERDRYLTLLVEMVAEFLQARKASVMVLDREQNALRILAAKGLDPEFVQNTRVEVGERIAGKVVETGRAMHVFDIEKENQYGRANNTAYYGTSSFISVPMKDDGEIIGVINVSDHVEGREFTEHDHELLESLSELIAGMLKKADAYELVSSNFEKLKSAMRAILELRETWGGKNLSNLTIVAQATARRLRLDEKALIAVRIGMNIYDLGLMKVPRHIRSKREKLSSRDVKRLMEHPNLGFSLISPMCLDERIKAIVRNHHERYDGKGYPDGLKGEEIPIEARIVSVVDAFRALITQGPYRKVYSFEEAREEIMKKAGSRFDPKVVEAFMKALNDLGAREENGQLVLDSITEELEKIRNSLDERDETDLVEEQEKVKEGAR